MGHGDFSVHGKQVVVVGAARSGIAAAELLVRKGAHVLLTERRDHVDGAERLRAAGVELELGGHGAAIERADLVVTSPGVPPDAPPLALARRRGVEVIGELELASRWVRGPIVAITGTKGKSTTTTLVGRMAGAGGRHVLVGGNIGVPLSAQIEESTPDTLHVVEVSSFQLEAATTFHPWIAVWLNFAADHLDRHESVEDYAEAKARIFASQTSGDWAVVNAEDATVMARSEGAAATRVPFWPSASPDDGFGREEGWIVRRAEGRLERIVPESAVELTGEHMVGNVVAATAVATLAGVASKAIRDGLRGFHGLEHVMEPVGTFGGVTFVNDSKATNVESARRSIESFPTGVVALVGGYYKGGDLRELRAPLAARGRGVVAIGEAAPRVREALAGVVPVVEAGSMAEAVERGHALAAPDGVVLLAPACASFDWFEDYAARGRAFKAEVAALAARTEGR